MYSTQVTKLDSLSFVMNLMLVKMQHTKQNVIERFRIRWNIIGIITYYELLLSICLDTFQNYDELNQS